MTTDRPPSEAADPNNRPGDPTAAIDQLLADARSEGERTRVGHLLQMIEPPAPQDPAYDPERSARIDALAARCLASTRRSGAAGRMTTDEQSPAVLEPTSAEAVDRAVATGLDGTHEGTDSPSVTRARTVLSLLNAGDDADTQRQARVDRVLESITEDQANRRSRMRLDPVTMGEAGTARRRPKLADFLALAAMIIMGVSVFATISDKLGADAKLRQNEANLAQAGLGMGLFANDHDARLPAVEQRADRPEWWQVGDRAHSHSANLFVLVESGYTPLAALAGPTNRFAPTTLTDEFAGDWRSSDEVSYSYQLFFKAPRVTDPRLRIVLGDRSPIAQHAAVGIRVNPLMNSRAHRGAGQHVLTRDNAVWFLESPLIESGVGTSDNIWLPGPSMSMPPAMIDFRHPAAPAADVFLAP